MTRAVVLVPGIMGSVLRQGADIVWPGDASGLHGGFRRFESLLQDDLVAGDVLRHLLVAPQYQALIDELAAWGFREEGDRPTLVTCPYDWRRANERSAETLADVVDQAARAHDEIVIVAHSMGGLVARHYLESGRFASRPAFPRVRMLVAIGAPHRGCPLALAAALGQERRLLLNRHQVARLAGDARFPSVYQLLPPAGEPCVWDANTGAPVDVYERGTAEALGLSPVQLECARAFHSSLDLRRRPPGVRYFFFYGARQTTAVHTWVRRQGSRLTAENVEIEGGGDGAVPVWSGLAAGIQGRPVGGEHDTLYRAPGVRRTLAALLGAQGPELPEPPVDLTVRDRVIDPAGAVRVVLGFGGPAGRVEGEVGIEAIGPDGAVAPSRSSQRVRYVGAAAHTLGLILDGPAEPGIYRVSYRGGDAAAQDIFFVQSRPTGPAEPERRT